LILACIYLFIISICFFIFPNVYEKQLILLGKSFNATICVYTLLQHTCTKELNSLLNVFSVDDMTYM